MRPTCNCITTHYSNEPHVPVGTRRLMRAQGLTVWQAINALRAGVSS